MRTVFTIPPHSSPESAAAAQELFGTYCAHLFLADMAAMKLSKVSNSKPLKKDRLKKDSVRRPPTKDAVLTRKDKKRKRAKEELEKARQLKGRTVRASSDVELTDAQGRSKKVKAGQKVRFVDNVEIDAEPVPPPPTATTPTTPQENGTIVSQALTSAADALAEAAGEEKRKKNSLTSFNPYEETRGGEDVIDVSIHPEARNVFYAIIRFDDNHVICIER